MYLRSHAHHIQGDPLPRPCTWGQCPISSVTPPPKPCTKFQNSTVSRVAPHHQTMHLWSHVNCLQGDPSPQTLHLGSYIHRLQSDPFKIPAPGSHVQSLLGDSPPRPCICTQISNFKGNLTPRPCTWGHTVTSPYLLTRTCTLGHMFTVSRLTPPHQNFYLWSRLYSLQGDHHSLTLNI